MSTSAPKKRKRLSPFLIALLMSALLHQVFLTAIGEFWPVVDMEPEKHQEVMLVEAPAKLQAPEPPAPKEKPQEKIRPETSPIRRRPQKQTTSTQKVLPSILSPPAGPPSELAAVPPAEPEAPTVPKEGVKLNLDWKNFESTFAEESKTEREIFAEKSLERRRGSGRFGRLSAKVERALKTNRGWVRPGNQEPLGDRQQIFHRYIDMIHQQDIHPLFGDSFWASLSNFTPGHPLNDWSLRVMAEFEIFANGHISEVRVVRTSGNAVFDAAAVDSVYRSSPFPAPPKEILSWNDRVYLRWGFYRNRRMCGVFNVEPYILKAPNAEKEPVSIDKYIVDDG
ncbi:MAG: energy transducer TonB [Proteobacteria bacterium]|nr:energy transducer TonB [Pseudomonadota bacterium]